MAEKIVNHDSFDDAAFPLKAARTLPAILTVQNLQDAWLLIVSKTLNPCLEALETLRNASPSLWGRRNEPSSTEASSKNCTREAACIVNTKLGCVRLATLYVTLETSAQASVAYLGTGAAARFLAIARGER